MAKKKKVKKKTAKKKAEKKVAKKAKPRARRTVLKTRATKTESVAPLKAELFDTMADEDNFIDQDFDAISDDKLL